MLDQAAYNSVETCFVEDYFVTRSQVKCIMGKIEADLLAASTHFQEANYSKHNGRPIVYIFLKEDEIFKFRPGEFNGEKQLFENCTSAPFCALPRGLGLCIGPEDCWKKIWRGAIAQTPHQPVVVFRNSHKFPASNYLHYNGIRHVMSDGMYAWVQPDGAKRPFIDPTTQSNFGDVYLRNFYDEGTCTTGGACSINTDTENTDASGEPRDTYGMLTSAAVYKGFDNYLRFTSGEFNESTQTYVKTVAPENHNVMAQRCGATWLDSWERINKGDHNTIGQNINIIQVATWNDYDEGTAIEPGIENCFTITGSVIQGVLYWILSTPGDVNGPYGAVRNGAIRTVNHFEVFYEDAEDVGGTQGHLLADQLPVSYYYTSVSSGTRCTECRDYHYHFQRDVSSILANYPDRLVHFYVKMIGEPGMVNKMSSTIPSDVVLSISRSSRPARDSSGQNSAFMQSLPPVPPEDQNPPDPDPGDPPPDPDPNPDPCGDGPCTIESLPPLLPPVEIGSTPSGPTPPGL